LLEKKSEVKKVTIFRAKKAVDENWMAFNEIRDFEIQLRRFISDRLREHYDEAGLDKGIDKKILKEWGNKKQSYIKEGRSAEAIMNYAEFSHYKKIITDNWDRIFKTYFDNDKEKFIFKFDDLNKSRNATMHAHEITRDEVGHIRFTIAWFKSHMFSS
jgi:hypothetical protein